MWISNGPFSVVKRTVGTGGVASGSLSVMSSNTAVKGAAAATDGTIFGVACADFEATTVGDFYKITDDTIIGAKYTGSTKTSLTDADLGKIFDLSDDATVNLDDVTGGCCVCEGYNNDNDIIYFKIAPAKLG